MNFDTSKNLGGVGAILLFVGVLVPYLSIYGSVLSLIGLILVLIGLKGLADYYKDAGVFSNFLYGIIAGIVGVIIAGVVTIYVVVNQLVSFLMLIFPSWDGNLSTLSSLQNLTPTTNISPNAVLPFIGGLASILVILFVFAVITAFLMNKSLKTLSKKSNVGLFATTGTLLLIGAILTIIAIGFILIWIAMILLAVAFFTLKPLPPQAATATTTQQPTPV